METSGTQREFVVKGITPDQRSVTARVRGDSLMTVIEALHRQGWTSVVDATPTSAVVIEEIMSKPPLPVSRGPTPSGRESRPDPLFKFGQFLVTHNTLRAPKMWGFVGTEFTISSVRYLELVPTGYSPSTGNFMLVSGMISLIAVISSMIPLIAVIPGIALICSWFIYQKSGWFAHVIVHINDETVALQMMTRSKADQFIAAFNQVRE